MFPRGNSMKLHHAKLAILVAATIALACTTAIAQTQAPAKTSPPPMTAMPAAAAPAAGAASVASPPALDLGDCPDVADAFELGKTYSCACPESALPDISAGSAPIYGALVYTGDSNICIAALHAGVLKPNLAARIAVVMVDSPAVFKGTTQNGVKSQVYATKTSVAFRFAPLT